MEQATDILPMMSMPLKPDVSSGGGSLDAERIVNFDCCGEQLVGILCSPEAPLADIGVVIVVGGPQYRAGSHRQFVQLSRQLARKGVPALRFDVRGMGDSEGNLETFESSAPDIEAAIRCLRTQLPIVRRVVLLGLCDGASASMLYWQTTHDPSIAGLVLVNPWVRSELSEARTQVRHYYLRRLSDPNFWLRLLKGRIALSGIVDFARSVTRAVSPLGRVARNTVSRVAPFQDRMAECARHFPGSVLLILSGQDLTAREFTDHIMHKSSWTALLQSNRLERHDLVEADHTFSTSGSRQEMEGLTCVWLYKLSRST